MKYQEEFKESACELFKQELEKDSSAHLCAFSDKSYLLNTSSQAVSFTFILNVKLSGDIMNFWQSCNSAENSYLCFLFLCLQSEHNLRMRTLKDLFITVAQVQYRWKMEMVWY